MANLLDNLIAHEIFGLWLRESVSLCLFLFLLFPGAAGQSYSFVHAGQAKLSVTDFYHQLPSPNPGLLKDSRIIFAWFKLTC